MDDEQKQKFEDEAGKKVYTDMLPLAQDGWDDTEQYLRRVVQVLLEYIQSMNNRQNKVLNFVHPEDLKKQFDFSIPDEPVELSQLIKDCEDTLKHQVKTGHPRFFNQISCGLDIVCMSGEWLTATANTNMFTYEIAPVFSLMERELLDKMIELVGWPQGDGIFAPGGSIANLYAVNAARHDVMPRCKPLGMTACPKLCMFTSEESHYSIRGAAAVTGIGTDLCFYVPKDGAGAMVPEALEQKVIEAKNDGLVPFFVAATAGTTVYGAFDPLHQIADICERHNMWMHVDAAWGGGILLSPTHRHLHSGIERADSVTWNPHKLMGALLQCSAVLIKKQGLLFQTNQMSADYLFQQDKPYDVTYDTGDKAMQCGRHNDVFKLWLMWRSKGMNGFADHMDNLMDLAAYFTERVRNTPGFQLVVDDPKFLNICFWYVPPSMRHLEEKEKMARLDKVAPKIKAGMMCRGSTMVAYQPDAFQNRPNFFRMIVSNQAMTRDDLDFLIQEIQDIAKDI